VHVNLIGAFLMPYNGSRDFLVHLLLTLKATFMAYVKGVASGYVYHTGTSIPMSRDKLPVLDHFHFWFD